MEHFRKFGIVGRSAGDRKIWTIEETLYARVFEDWFGGKFQTHPAFQHGVEAVAEAAKAECLLWKGNETVDVAGSDLVKKMYSFVIVRPIRHKAGEDMTTQVLFDFIARQREFDRAIPGMQFKIQVMHH